MSEEEFASFGDQEEDAVGEKDSTSGESLLEQNASTEAVASMGLDGSTPLEAGIQGRLTEAGGKYVVTRNEYDWQVHVDVDQPVQQRD